MLFATVVICIKGEIIARKDLTTLTLHYCTLVVTVCNNIPRVFFADSIIQSDRVPSSITAVKAKEIVCVFHFHWGAAFAWVWSPGTKYTTTCGPYWGTIIWRNSQSSAAKRHYSTNEKCSMLYQTSLFHLSPDGPLMDTENCFILPLYSSIVSV